MKNLPLKGSGALVVGEVITSLSNAVHHYITTKAETTVRIAEIEAKKEVLLTHLNQQHNLLTSYVDKVFAERSMVLQQSFSTLQYCIEQDNTAGMQMALQMIVTTIKTEPWAEFGAFQAAIKDPTQSFEF